MGEYYAIKHKKSKRWVGYKLTKRQLGSLHEDYEFRGPYSGYFKAMVAVNEERKAGDAYHDTLSIKS